MKKILYFAAVIVLAFVGCSKSDDVNTQNEQFTITATIGDVNTRTSYTDETADATKGLKVEWEANEKISVVEVNENGVFTNNYWTFTSNNAAGTTATFTAPNDFATTDGCNYIAVYPALTDGVNGPYAGVAQNDVAALIRDNSQFMELHYLRTDYFNQKGATNMDILKAYDVMVSPIEFSNNNADINLVKLNAVIKFDLQLPNDAVDNQIYKLTFSGTNDFTYSDGGIGLSYIVDNKLWWSYGNTNSRLSILLKNETDSGYMIVPEGGKISVYVPVAGSKLGQSVMNFLRKNDTYTIKLDGVEKDYSASKTMGDEDIVLEQGKVYVIKAALVEIEE